MSGLSHVKEEIYGGVKRLMAMTHRKAQLA
jgi:hypothetical protein